MSIDIAIIGAGARGQAYARYALDHPDEMRVVAVADPDAARRDGLGEAHDVPAGQRYAGWQDFVGARKVADAVVNATMDRTHYASTLALLDAGYNVLLEKPMSPVLAENVRLVAAAEESGRLLQVCHVLRYTAFWRTVRHLVQSGRLGQIITVDHRENLVFWHMAHSFVRGNWRRRDESGPMILTKCCHDFDLLNWILGQPVAHLNSFGGLSYFTMANKPPGAPTHCSMGCPVAESCKFDAVRLYVREPDNWIGRVLTPDRSAGARTEALVGSPYDRCVYQCDNDVVDHQTVNMVLESGTTITLTMNGHSDEECRSMRYDGTRGTLYAKFGAAPKINVRDHRTGATEHIQVPTATSGHGGGDYGVMRSFLNALIGGVEPDLSSARASLESHLLAFAAEQACRSGKVIDMAAFRGRALEG